VLLPTTDQNGLNNTSVETLIERSESENLNIQLSKLQAKLASLETGKYNWKSSISVDAVGQVTRQEIDGSGQYGSASARETNALIGLQVSIPLSTGGYRQAKLEENVQLASQAQINVDRTRQQIAQHIKHTYLQINIGESRVEAISQALEAGRKRLDATRLGREVGDRTTLDVLNAENDVSFSQLQLIQAQVNLLLNQLQLAALTARLNENNLRKINALLTTNK
jgi:outer membrane protein